MENGTSVTIEQLIEDMHEAICATNRHLNRLQKEVEQLRALLEPPAKEQSNTNHTGAINY